MGPEAGAKREFMKPCDLGVDALAPTAARTITRNMSVDASGTPSLLLQLSGNGAGGLALVGMRDAPGTALHGTERALHGTERVDCALDKRGNVARLFAAERRTLADQRPERVAEFARGRACARRALLAVGLRPTPILMGADGEPLWPDTVVGSISHTPGYTCALVARGLDAVGVDVERYDRELSPRAWRLILSGAELQGEGQREQVAVFGIKEAFFKLAWPSTRRRFGFTAVRVCLFGPGRGCEVRLVEALSGAFRRGATFFGNYVYGRGFALAWFCTPPGGQQVASWR